MHLPDREIAKTRASSLTVAALLAAAGGFLDGFTYIGHGQVFANAMSANIILLGAYLFIRSWESALPYLLPVLAFLAAVWSSEAIQLHSKRSGSAAPYISVLSLEVVALAILSALPSTVPDAVFTTAVAFVAALQMQTFREVNGRVYGSTFTTGNLRTLGEALFGWAFEGRRRSSALVVRDFAVIIVAFLAGAIAGGVTTKAFQNAALRFDIGMLILVAIRVQMPVAIWPAHQRKVSPV